MSSITRARIIMALALAFATLGLASEAFAQDAPPYLSHQGRLFDADNQPMTGVTELTFRLYDGPTEDAIELWAETISVNLSNGYYTIALGQQTALPQGLFNGEQRFLGVTVTSEGEELLPRLELNSVAYALHAAVAENAIGDITPRSISVGGQPLVDETGAWVGAPPAINTGFALTGDGSSGAPLEVDASAFAPVASSGSYGDLTDAPDTLGGLGCAGFGELPKWDGSAWTCGTDNGEVYTAGFGLALSVAGEFGVNLAEIQARVAGACSAGEAIGAIGQDGTVTCVAAAAYTAGDGLSLTGNTFAVDQPTVEGWIQATAYDTEAELTAALNDDYLSSAYVPTWDDITGIPAGIADGDQDTTYSAGTALTLSGTTFNVSQATVEGWIQATAYDNEAELTAALNDNYLASSYTPSWASLTGVPAEIADGDDNTTYAAGAGLTLSGTTFSVNNAAVQSRVIGACAAGQAIRAIGADGTVTCEADDSATYAAGVGLNLSGTTFNVDTAAIQSRVVGSCAAGQSIRAIAANGTVTCEADDSAAYVAGAGLLLSGTTFSVNANAVQSRVTGACGANEAIRAINTDGSVACITDDNATYAAGTGLTLSGTTFNVNTTAIQARVIGTCAAGQAIRTIAANGGVTCETTGAAGVDLQGRGQVFVDDTGRGQGQAATFQFDGGGEGVVLEYTSGESGGFFANGDTAAIWSPGDTTVTLSNGQSVNSVILALYDEDTLNTGGPDSAEFTFSSFDVRRFAHDNGAYLSSGGVWTNVSNREVKSRITPVDNDAILERLAGLEITEWTYNEEADDGFRHLGPMAQDFHAAFGLGYDETSIPTVDADGVALAAIQALRERNLDLKNQVDALEQRLEQLEAAQQQ